MMKIMDKINNHFLKSVEYNTFEITENSIIGSFTETYLVGMYVIIKGSYLNDGLYQITAVANNELTLDGTLQPEDTNESFRVYASSPPQEFVDLATKINAYNETGIGADSESIDDYSISYKGDGSWESVYANKLNTYRRVYSDLMISNKYNWQNRLW